MPTIAWLVAEPDLEPRFPAFLLRVLSTHHVAQYVYACVCVYIIYLLYLHILILSLRKIKYILISFYP